MQALPTSARSSPENIDSQRTLSRNSLKRQSVTYEDDNREEEDDLPKFFIRSGSEVIGDPSSKNKITIPLCTRLDDVDVDELDFTMPSAIGNKKRTFVNTYSDDDENDNKVLDESVMIEIGTDEANAVNEANEVYVASEDEEASSNGDSDETEERDVEQGLSRSEPVDATRPQIRPPKWTDYLVAIMILGTVSFFIVAAIVFGERVTSIEASESEFGKLPTLLIIQLVKLN